MDPRMLVESLYAENADRRKRWAYLTDGIETMGKAGNGEDPRFADLVRRDQKHRRIVCEMLLDNMQDYVARPKMFLGETTVMADIPLFTTFGFPLVRRVFPKLIANDLVSVQPMTGPTGLIFYLDFTYGTTRSLVTAGQRLDQVFDNEYGNVAAGQTVPEINMKLTQVTVTAEPRKLRAKWQIEAQQDLQSQYGLDAESELMGVQAGEIAREIDRDVVEDLLANATAGNVNWSKVAPAGAPYNALDPKVYKNTLYDAIVDANDLVFKKRYRNANWLVAGPDVCSRLEKLENFKLVEGADDAMREVGIIRFGNLARRWTVYKDPLFEADKILLGFKGPSFLETGYVYAPYIPAWVTPLVTDVSTFELTRGMMSRYAKKVVVGDFYSTCTLTAS